jgi:hypothetical protein
MSKDSDNAESIIAEWAKDADVKRALEILRKPRTGEPPRPGDEVPESWLRRRENSSQPTRSK